VLVPAIAACSASTLGHENDTSRDAGQASRYRMRLDAIEAVRDGPAPAPAASW
jgi:hypothetical protein